MSQAFANTAIEGKVVVSLQPGPKGTLRLSYEFPQLKMSRSLLPQQQASWQKLASSFAPSAIEIDPEKLRKLQFSKEDLVEIGFSLVKQLWAQSALAQHVA
jgi:hypothetical protein